MISKKNVVTVCCMILLRLTKGEQQTDNDSGNRVWNFFFGGKDPQGPACSPEFLTCETRNASVTYVRWGRRECNEATADTVYSGYVGGGHYTNSGAGTNPLCLPESPEYDSSLVASGGSRSRVYGGEYETNTYSRMSDVHEHDPLCAVCLARGRSTTLMIPAKRTCPQGWTKEYGGLLMGEYHGHAGNHEFVCMDRNPQGRPGSSTNDNGILFYAAVGKCGSLPCPPYIEEYELPCVVCSR